MIYLNATAEAPMVDTREYRVEPEAVDSRELVTTMSDYAIQGRGICGETVVNLAERAQLNVVELHALGLLAEKGVARQLRNRWSTPLETVNHAVGEYQAVVDYASEQLADITPEEVPALWGRTYDEARTMMLDGIRANVPLEWNEAGAAVLAKRTFNEVASEKTPATVAAEQKLAAPTVSVSAANQTPTRRRIPLLPGETFDHTVDPTEVLVTAEDSLNAKLFLADATLKLREFHAIAFDETLVGVNKALKWGKTDRGTWVYL